jgi:hypothetical protein
MTKTKGITLKSETGVVMICNQPISKILELAVCSSCQFKIKRIEYFSFTPKAMAWNCPECKKLNLVDYD